jgi:hypothetical protein
VQNHCRLKLKILFVLDFIGFSDKRYSQFLITMSTY